MATIYVGGDSPDTTIQEGIEAAEQSGATSIVISAGTYSENDSLTAADDGLNISAAGPGVEIDGSMTITDASSITVSGISFQGDGTNIAVTALDSQQITITDDSFSGAGEAVVLDGTGSSTVSNNVMLDTAGSAIEAKNGANGNLITGNVIGGDGAPETQGAIWLHGANDTTISHNQITDTSGAAISLTDFDAPGDTATQNNNDLILDNTLNDIDTQGQDSGAIYILGRSQNPDANDTVQSNFIGTMGSPGAHAVGIYLDDNASGITVTQNIVQGGENMSDPWEIHGGSNNTLSGNIFNLGSGNTDFGLFQSDESDQQPQGSFAQLENDLVTGNIFFTESPSPHDPGFADLSGGTGDPSIVGNDFWSYSTAPINVAGTGATGDSNAVYDAPATSPPDTLGEYGSISGDGIDFRAIDVSQIGPNVACYCRGTLILTDRGEVAVEALAVGDRVITRAGKARPIRWIGRRSYDRRFVAANRAVLPVVIRAGALADGIPSRDLAVSPKHALFIDEVLVPAECLVNGVSVVRRDHMDALSYFHLELDCHDILLADGAPAESFADCDNRGMFQNAHSAIATGPRWQFCAERIEDGPMLAAIRAKLAARAGLPGTHHVLPIAAAGTILATLGAKVTEIHLHSSSGFAPGDRRRLGAAITSVRVDGTSVDLADPALAHGFHPAEGSWRWTDGCGILRLAIGSAPRTVTIEIGAIIEAKSRAA